MTHLKILLELLDPWIETDRFSRNVVNWLPITLCIIPEERRCCGFVSFV